MAIKDAGFYEQQINDLTDQIAGRTKNMGNISDYFQSGIQNAYGNNMPLMREAANLEAGAYSLPGNLLEQYNQDFGSVRGGASAGARINSILGRVGSQFAMADTANRLLDQRNARIEDAARSLVSQYQAGTAGLQTKLGSLQNFYNAARQREAEQRAAARAAAARASMQQPSTSIADLLSKQQVQQPATERQKQLNQGIQGIQGLVGRAQDAMQSPYAKVVTNLLKAYTGIGA